MAEQEEEKSRNMGFGFCSYSDVQPTHLVSPSHLQGFDPNSSEIYSLASGIEMIGFQPKTFLPNWQENNNNNGREESSLRYERPSQGLSLSLSSTNPSSIGLHSFELRQTHQHQHQGDHFRLISSDSGDGLGGRSGFQQVMMQEQEQEQEQGQQVHHLMRSSKYLGPAQELLNEFCCLGITQATHDYHDDPQKLKQKQIKQANNNKGYEDDSTNTGCSRQQASLYALDLMELQKRKTKLLAMLEEVHMNFPFSPFFPSPVITVVCTSFHMGDEKKGLENNEFH